MVERFKFVRRELSGEVEAHEKPGVNGLTEWSLKEINDLYKREKKSAGERAAFDAVKELFQSFDGDTRFFLKKNLEVQIALTEGPHAFEFALAPVATICGSVFAVATAAITLIAGMASSAIGLGSPESSQAVLEMGDICVQLFALLFNLAAVVIVGVIVPVMIHKMVLRSRLERYYLLRAAFK